MFVSRETPLAAVQVLPAAASAPAEAPEGKAAPSLPEDFDYAPIDPGAVVASVVSGAMVKQFAAPWVSKLVVRSADRLMPRDEAWAKAHPYRATARDAALGWVVDQALGVIQAPLAAAIQGAMHNIAPGFAKQAPKSYTPQIPPAPDLAADLVKSVTVPMMVQWLKGHFAPPPPPEPAPAPEPPAEPAPAPEPPAEPPAPAPEPPPAGDKPPGGQQPPAAPPSGDNPPAEPPAGGKPTASETDPAGAPAPAASKEPPATGSDWQSDDAEANPEAPPRKRLAEREIFGHTLGELGDAALESALSVGISAFYDQTVGPVVQRQMNRLFGRDDAEVSKPRPLTPGKLASSMVATMFKKVFIEPAQFPKVVDADGNPVAPGAGAVLGQGILNGLIGASFSTMYSRGLGQAIEDTVNGWAGIEPAERNVPTLSGERLVRTLARSTMAGAVSHVAASFSQPLFMQLAQQLGGSLGPFVAMAGAAMVGMVAATASDALLGQQVGRLGARIWSWVTGEPTTEERIAKAQAEQAVPQAEGEAPAPAGASPTAPPAAAPPAGAPAAGAPAAAPAPASPPPAQTAGAAAAGPSAVVMLAALKRLADALASAVPAPAAV